MATNAHARAADPGAAALIGKISTVEDTASVSNGQVRCAGCGRRPRAPRLVEGWCDDRAVALCARCAAAWRKYAALLAEWGRVL
jgi:hypothetical protein